MKAAHAPERWFGDRAAWRLVGMRYLPWLAALNLAWEIVQLPLYKIWREASAAYIAFAVAHCTAGDVLIGMVALALGLIATRAGPVSDWRWVAIGAVTTLSAVLYTIASEWMNTSLREGWRYSELMPTIELRDQVIGASPLAQWLVLPPIALYLARRSVARRSGLPAAPHAEMRSHRQYGDQGDAADHR